jgi:hypothetical protein
MSGWNRQLAGLVLLRATLLKNQLFKKGRRLAGAASVLLVLLVALSGLGAGAGSFLLGAALAHENPEQVGYVWHGYMVVFVFFWFVGLVTDLQRAEALDIRRLLHLPISFDRLFCLNFVASLVCPTIAFTAPAFLGLALGSALVLGPAQLLVLVVCAGVVLAVAAASYALSGWLARLMENKRTRRTVLTIFPLCLILIAQAPQIGLSFSEPGPDAVSVADPRAKPTPAELAEREVALRRRVAHQDRERRFVLGLEVVAGFLPPLWPGSASTALSEGRVATPLLATIGSLALVAWALLRALRSGRRHYTEGEGGAAPQAAPPPVAASARPSRFLEASIRGLPEDVSAMAAASLRMIVREPVFRLSLLSLPILLVVFAGIARQHSAAPEWQRHFIPMMAAAMSLLIIHKHTTNAFGTDRDGFRLFVLLPTPRARLLLGRNLSLLPVTLVLGVPILAVLAALRGLGAAQVATGLLELPLAHVLSCTLGNFLSILNPFRVSVDGAARNKANPGFLAVLELLLALPLVTFPLALPPLAEVANENLQVLEGVPAGPLAALLLLALALAFYALSLPWAGRFLAERERNVLEKLTRASE